MIYIAHRGNTKGPNPNKENHPDYIRDALHKGYDAEIDVWYIDGKYILGHDAPQYEVPDYFLQNDKLWCHAKNMAAIIALVDPGFSVHTFFHDTDHCTLTSQKWIWTYPNQNLILGPRSVAVMPERVLEWDVSKAGAICTDNPLDYQLGRRQLSI
jgi:hypothetical protein